ncbi:MAG: GNAT family N-acetyltransferase [Acidimicrobiales bacterium]
MTIRLREATPADAAALAALLAGGTLDPSREDPADPEPYRDALAEIAAAANAWVLVAEDDDTGEVVGMCQLFVFRHVQERGRRCAEIESAHVRSDRRGQGIGAMLAAACVERAQAAGCYRVQLTSNARRHDAHRFWERQGFTASHLGFKRSLDGPAPGPAREDR